MQRAYDMIIHDIALQNLNVALCMDRAGLSGDDGPTHHGLFDIGYLRHIPRVSRYLERNLAHPRLAPLKRWFDTHLPAARREVT